ncbi:MAG: OmpA family protein [Clostridia bacterium]|nr:OmpA family protein [Clostridia bacterium]
MSKKKQHHEEHVDETWLIPYADILTLLLALFIVMFSISQVDKQKIARLSEQFNIIFSGGTGVIEKYDGTIIPIQTPTMSNTNGSIEDRKMKEVKKALDAEIEKKGYSDKIKVILNREGLEISIQDVVLFKSGEAEILNEATPLLEKISTMLNNLDNDIKILGHTDNVPIHTPKFRSNWDLSAMRAINVMNFMVNKGNLRSDKFSIQAHGEYMPKFSNSTEEGRTKNRRVEILLVRKYPLEAKEIIQANGN